MAATCSGGQTAPDGLSGLTNRSTLVRSVRAASSWSIVTWKPVSSVVSTIFGTPPASVIASGYVVQYGEGTITSSPGSHSAANAVNTACFPPLVTSTCADRTGVAAVAQRLGGDRLAQFGEPGRRRVAVVSWITARRHRCRDDVLRRWEVRLAGPESDDVLAGRLQGLGLGIDGEGRRLGDGREAG